MFPYHAEVVDRDGKTSVSMEDPAEPPPPGPTAVEQSETLEAEPNQNADPETEESEDIDVSAQSADIVPDEANGNNGNDCSGEFVVTMLARSNLEEQAVGTEGTSSSTLSENVAEEAPPLQSHRDEDVMAESWRQHRKHVFVLSEAGKPIYSRYGSEEALSSTMGVMMALVSFVQSGDNMIRSVYSGEASQCRVGLAPFFLLGFINTPTLKDKPCNLVLMLSPSLLRGAHGGVPAEGSPGPGVRVQQSPVRAAAPRRAAVRVLPDHQHAHPGQHRPYLRAQEEL